MSASPASRLVQRRAAHRRIALAATFAVVQLALALPTPGLALQAALALPAVLLLGVPHGAFDLLVTGRERAARGRPRSWTAIAAVAAAYVGTALAVVGLWLVAPPLGLALFVAVSAVHFGRGDAAGGFGASALEVLVRGTLPIVLPAAFHAGDVGLLFAWLLGTASEPTVAALQAAAPWLVMGWATAAGVLVARERARGTLSTPALAELAALVLVALALPPLFAFAVYFCLWHAARHLLALDGLLNAGGARRRALVAAAVPVLGATLLLLGAGYALAARGAEAVDLQAAVRTLFVGLAALTVPHAAVTRLVERFYAAWSAQSHGAGISDDPIGSFMFAPEVHGYTHPRSPRSS